MSLQWAFVLWHFYFYKNHTYLLVNLQYVVTTLLWIITHRVQLPHLISYLVCHLLLHVDVGRWRLTTEGLHHQGQATLFSAECCPTLGVDVLFDSVPVGLRDAKPVDQVTWKQHKQLPVVQLHFDQSVCVCACTPKWMCVNVFLQ